MAINFDLDPTLLEEARRLGGHKTQGAAVEAALKEYVRKRKTQGILELFGKVAFDQDYDYKAYRSR